MLWHLPPRGVRLSIQRKLTGIVLILFQLGCSRLNSGRTTRTQIVQFWSCNYRLAAKTRGRPNSRAQGRDGSGLQAGNRRSHYPMIIGDRDEDRRVFCHRFEHGPDEELLVTDQNGGALAGDFGDAGAKEAQRNGTPPRSSGRHMPRGTGIRCRNVPVWAPKMSTASQ